MLKEKRIRILKAQLRQVSNYLIPTNKESTSTEPGISNISLANWKKNRMEELRKEISKLKGERQDE